MTYSGSTERCSASEEEPRTYNILTFDENAPALTRRQIQTREFVTIPVRFEETSPDRIYAAIDAYSEKIKDAVVFVELTGIKKALIAISEIEEYVKNKGAVVVRVGDKRDLEKEDAENYNKIIFKDPDEVVVQELRKLNLTEAGVLLDGIIRDSETAKSNIAAESEKCLKELLEQMDFKEEIRRADVTIEKTLETKSDPAEIIQQLQEMTDEKDSKEEAEAKTKENETTAKEREIKSEDTEVKAEETEAIKEKAETMGEETEIKKKDPESKKEEKKRPKIPHQYTLGDRFGEEARK